MLVRSSHTVCTGWISMPGVSSGKRKSVRPRCLGAFGFVRVRRKTYCARCAPLVNIFWPSISQSPSSWLAARVVAVPAEVRARAQLGGQLLVEERASLRAHGLRVGVERELDRPLARRRQRHLGSLPETARHLLELCRGASARERSRATAAEVELDV